MSEIKYKRVMLKVSGEALAGAAHRGLDFDVINSVCVAIKECVDMGVQVGLMVGAGNFWRGRQADPGMNRTTADHMGMIATVINALAIQDRIERKGVASRVMTELEMPDVAEKFIFKRALRHFEKGRVIIFACGTGNPYFSTDTGAALKAAQVGANALLLAKNVDGVYDSDPKTNPNAKKYDTLTYMDVISQGLKATDTTAITMCMENEIPVIAFSLMEEDAMKKAIRGEAVGTYIGK